MKKEQETIKVGACGICCESCGLYAKKICSGCPKTKEGVAFLKNISANCPILECVVEKGIEVCSRDCSEFPCIKFKGWPLAEAWLNMFKARLKSKK